MMQIKRFESTQHNDNAAWKNYLFCLDEWEFC